MTLGEYLAPRGLILAAVVIFVAGFMQLAVKLYEVQVVDASDYIYAGTRQSTRRVQTAGARGRILDRNGLVLAENRISYSIVCNLSEFQQFRRESLLEKVSKVVTNVTAAVGRKSSLSRTEIERHAALSLAMPLVILKDVREDEIARFFEHESEYPACELIETWERVYPCKNLAAHVIGYVGRERGDANAGDIKYNYYTPELKGRAGIESYYDDYLRGVPGEKSVIVDARGFLKRESIITAPQVGLDLRLTLDAKLQRATEAQLAGASGACVVLDPRNGDVLVMASAPGYNLNEFVPILTKQHYARLTMDSAKPLLNRASGGSYAPGSTFKPLTAIAGMMAGRQPEVTCNCTGVFEFGTMRLRCASRWGHGSLDLSHALMKSCNPFFCELGIEAGTNMLMKTAKDFGLGEKTGLDLGVDAAGVVPDAEWKRRMYDEKWFAGDLVQMSIGQGMLLVTPLQMARVAGAIGTGNLVKPHLKLGLDSESRTLPYPRALLATVRQGMRFVVDGDGEDRGTGWRGGVDVKVSVAGKTGTAEVGSGENRRKNVWFIAYAPAEAPTLAIALVLENGQSGGGDAAPKVAEILKVAFEERSSSSKRRHDG